MQQPAVTSAWRSDARARFARTSARPWNVDILLVEDDAADTALILDALKRNPNVGKLLATDAPAAVLSDLARGAIVPNLIILDIHMPKLNGFRFLEALRRIPSMRDTPVVFLTTSKHANDVKQAQASTMRLYVVKPNTHEELQMRLGHVVGQACSGSWSK